MRWCGAAVMGCFVAACGGPGELSPAERAGLSGGEVTLLREGGRWLIDKDLSCITPGCDP